MNMKTKLIHRIEIVIPLIMCTIHLYVPSDLEAQERRRRRASRYAHRDEIEHFLYEESNLDSALHLCKKVAAIQNIPNEYRREIKNNINLIENYSDYDQKPLRLYLQARKLTRLSFRGHASTGLFVNQGNRYRELLSLYPHCKLAAFARYLLGRHYESQIANTLQYLENEEARQKAIEEYREIIVSHSQAVFTIWDYPYDYQLGQQMAPIAQIRTAWLYQSSYHLNPNIGRALEAFRIVIDKYPDALDRGNRKLVLSAYVSMLNIYAGKNGTNAFIDTLKARKICNILLSKYPNQQYEIEAWYFGEIHPEAYMVLAKLETDRNKAIKWYNRIIKDYPQSKTGKSGSDAVTLYSTLAQKELSRLRRK